MKYTPSEIQYFLKSIRSLYHSHDQAEGDFLKNKPTQILFSDEGEL